MPHPTPIEWATLASNPIYARNKITGKRGWLCVKVNRDCTNCYAESQNLQPGPRGGTGLKYSEPNLALVDICVSDNELQAMRRCNRSGRIKDKNGLDRPTCFIKDMGDLFGHWIPPHMRDLVLDACEANPRVYWMLLTKRPERMRDYFLERWACKQPPEHIWLGTSAGRQEYADEFLPLLLETPAAFRFWSYEPATERVEASRYLPGLDLVIIGGESGDAARPMDPAWALELIEQCRKEDVAAFFKQFGEHAARLLKLKHKKGGGDLIHLPAEFQIRQLLRQRSKVL